MDVRLTKDSGDISLLIITLCLCFEMVRFFSASYTDTRRNFHSLINIIE